MNASSPITRVASGLVMLTVTILIGLDLAGFIPEARDLSLEERLRITEQLALRVASAATQDELGTVRHILRDAVQRDDQLLSAGLRLANHRLVVEAGPHQRIWLPEYSNASSASHIRVPLERDAEQWGTLELRFAGDARSWLVRMAEKPLVRLLAVTSIVAFAAYLLYLRHVLRHLDPSAVIPARVQTTLDVMAEGVLLIDEKERIVLANTACREKLDLASGALVGKQISDLSWRGLGGPGQLESPPWVEALGRSQSSTGTELRLLDRAGDEHVFVVNASPVLDGWGKAKGAVVTLDDVTELEQKKAALEEILSELEKSRDEIRLQNEELKVMARTDPLTGVANRRYFMEGLDQQFEFAASRNDDLSLIMTDIDHFKAINDNHGHPAGDEVIRRLAGALASEVNSMEYVCRYGGEEFAILLADTSATEAAETAERIRKRVETPGFCRMPVTASFGVSSLRFGAQSVAELIDQADAALYHAKENGRNRVTTYDPRQLAAE